MKKILFPFFKERHKFLLEKWWFRLLIVVFATFVIATPPIMFSTYHSENSDWCWKDVQRGTIEGAGDREFREHANYCLKVTQGAAWEAFFVSIASLIFCLYVVQFVFFKIVIDFIILGKKEGL